MLLAHIKDADPLMPVIEASATAIAIAVAFGWPKIGSKFFHGIESIFARVARNPRRAVAICGISALLLRIALLPLIPKPKPFTPDDFSFLLAADTFAHGRLTNSVPVMWAHFESIHITMLPTYMSMYFPAQGLVMAASKILFGHPWYGIL